jgi:hypothetical protein
LWPGESSWRSPPAGATKLTDSHAVLQPEVLKTTARIAIAQKIHQFKNCSASIASLLLDKPKAIASRG